MTTTTATKARSGFHLFFRVSSGVTADGTPWRRNTPERCTCSFNGNHATAPVSA